MRSFEGDGFSKKKNTDWNLTDMLIEWRKNYETVTNQFLEHYGREERIDVRSYEAQGIDRIPTIHLGHYAHRLEQSGIHSDRGDINREIEEQNRQIMQINSEIEYIKQTPDHESTVESPVEYEAEKELDVTFHARAAEHHRDYDTEEYMEVDEPSSDNAEDLIEHYTRTLENIRRAAETVGLVLTEKGKHSLAVQQRNIENALEQLNRQKEQNLDPPPLEGEKRNLEDISREMGLGSKSYEMEQYIRESYDAWVKQQEEIRHSLTGRHELYKIRQTGQGNERPSYSQSDKESDRQQEKFISGPQKQPEPEVTRELDYQYRPPPFRRHREVRHLAQSKRIAEQRKKFRDKGQEPEPAEDHGSHAPGGLVHERPSTSPGHERHLGFNELQGNHPPDEPHQKESTEASENQNPPHHSTGEGNLSFSEIRDELIKEHGGKKEQEQGLPFDKLREKLKKEQEEKKEQERKHDGRDGYVHKRKW